MKKKLLLLFTPLLLLLSACLNDPVQDDLLNYSNNEIPKVSEIEIQAVEAYDSVSGANYTDDFTMYNTLVDDVIPQYREFIEELEKIEVETDELRALHEDYIKAANTQYNAFAKIVSALEKQDPELIVEANVMLDEARKGMRQYASDIKKLAKEHKVTFEKEEKL
ncbi:hypothetical protein CHN50_01640 [Priestia aryabhattai]|uniref:hypothetical protein n=1 Tax=Priestia flexa TaxID=86664 RepID=UPI000BA0919E|nr:hypothetical protein [Priestia flexa]MDT2047109.1 hypothetical protein [Priestia flexa]OZT14307.1 hypothetical protein CHN50_01640 [Priestia aryabhattai]USY56767.1 hypothetical protein NIZ91_08975 [Bacillus sp. 1780r2a1]